MDECRLLPPGDSVHGHHVDDLLQLGQQRDCVELIPVNDEDHDPVRHVRILCSVMWNRMDLDLLLLSGGHWAAIGGDS